MVKSGFINSSGIKLICFFLVAVMHAIVIIYAAFRMDITVRAEEPIAGVMKLVDIQEDIPRPLSPPPPPPQLPLEEDTSDMPADTQELIAETMIETDEPPPPAVLGGGPGSGITGARGGTGTGQIVYLPQHMITLLPVLPEDQIVRNTIYPPIAQRSNIEGSVYLELFIDRQGNIREVRILRETPTGRGFGEAAVNAFKGISGKPAEANGEPVAVRYRYNISFTLR